MEENKVLELIWETEADRLRVDVKLNLGAKKAGLRLMENVVLNEEPEKALLNIITKRELWRVAQGQYDPLGLLCAFTIRFKILMRSIVEERSQKVAGWDVPVPAGTNEEFRRVFSHLGNCEPSPSRGRQSPRRRWWANLCCWYSGMAQRWRAVHWPSCDGRWLMAQDSAGYLQARQGWCRSAKSQFPGWSWWEHCWP